MPTPRLLKDYPPEFEATFRAACKEPFTIVCSNEQEAKQQRFHLYAYRAAIRLEPLSEQNRELKTMASLLSFKIKGSSITIYRPRKISNIQQALENVKSPSASAVASEPARPGVAVPVEPTPASVDDKQGT